MKHARNFTTKAEMVKPRWQVDHSTQALLRDGVSFIMSGWFAGGYGHESVGLPPVRLNLVVILIGYHRHAPTSNEPEQTRIPSHHHCNAVGPSVSLALILYLTMTGLLPTSLRRRH